LLIDHIVVEKDALIIKHIIPTTDDCRLLPGRKGTRMNWKDKQSVFPSIRDS